ncbi:MAG: HdeD family acid-resistance protein [Chlorobi bacterium]|nr:HdeD family acid-resistance protein [Chlorobiota bacterium]
MKNLISEAISAIKNWWLYLIIGVILVLGGIWVARTPLESYLALSILFIVLLLVNGISQIVFSVSNRKVMPGWGWYLTSGILETLIGIYLWSYPAISMAVLPFVVGFWLLFRGISVIASSTDLKQKAVKGWGWILTFGILSTILSFFIIMNPVVGVIYLVYLTAFSMIFSGIAYIMFSLKLKKIKSSTLDAAKDLKEGVEELKKSVMEHLKDVDDATKDKVSKLFDDYK